MGHVPGGIDIARIVQDQKAADVYADIGLIPRRIDIAAVYDRSFALPAG